MNKNILTIEKYKEEAPHLGYDRNPYEDAGSPAEALSEKKYILTKLQGLKNLGEKLFVEKIEKINNTTLYDEQYKENYTNGINALNEKWANLCSKINETLENEEDLATLKRVANEVCFIECCAYYNDLRNDDMIPIWEVEKAPSTLISSINNLELLLGDIYNTVGSLSANRLDKSVEGHIQNYKVDRLFENAVKKSDVDGVIQAIRDGANLNFSIDEQHCSALNFALDNNLGAVANVLIESGANLEIEDCMWDERFQKMVAVPPIVRCFLSGNSELRNKMLDKGVSTVFYFDNGKTLLDFAVDLDELETMKKVIKNGCEVNTVDVNGITPLIHMISLKRDIEYIDYIIGHGADVNYMTPSGKNAIFEAMLYGREDVIKRLMDEGAELNRGSRRTKRIIKSILTDLKDDELIKRLLNLNIVNEGDLIELIMDSNDSLLLKIMVDMGWEFDFNKVGTKLLLSNLMSRNSIENVEIVLSRIKNLDINSDEINVRAIVNIIQEFGNSTILYKMYNIDNSIDMSKFKLNLRGTEYLTPKYMEHVEKVKSLGVEITYEPLKVANKEFNKLVIDMIKGEEKYKELEITDEIYNVRDEKGRSILHYAASYSNVEFVRNLLDKIGVNILDNDGQSALVYALKFKKDDIAMELIKYERTNINMGNGNRDNCIYYAIKNGNADIVESLLKNNNAVFSVNLENKTPLHIAIELGETEIARRLIDMGSNLAMEDKDGNTPFAYAVKFGNLEIAQKILQKETSMNLGKFGLELAKEDKDGKTSLFWAVKRENEEMINFLIKNGSDINYENKFLETPLIYAVKNGYLRSIDTLIECGANLNIQEYDPLSNAGSRKTVLHYAAEKNDIQLISYLMARGANPYKKDKLDKCPIDIEKLERQYDELKAMIISSEFNRDRVENLIREMGDSINLPYPRLLNFTAIQYAAYKGNLEVVKLLYDNGANINNSDAGAIDPLMSSIIAGKEECALFLIENGANLNHIDSIGNNALNMAIYKKLDRVAEKIIDMGEGINQESKFGTPLLMAIECKNVNIIKKLLAKKADIMKKNFDGKTLFQMIKELKEELKRDTKEYNLLDSEIKKYEILEKLNMKKEKKGLNNLEK